VIDLSVCLSVCLQALSRLCGSAADMEKVGSTQQRLDVLEQSIARISSQAEQHGAVQQVRRRVGHGQYMDINFRY